MSRAVTTAYIANSSLKNVDSSLKFFVCFDLWVVKKKKREREKKKSDTYQINRIQLAQSP